MENNLKIHLREDTTPVTNFFNQCREYTDICIKDKDNYMAIQRSTGYAIIVNSELVFKKQRNSKINFLNKIFLDGFFGVSYHSNFYFIYEKETSLIWKVCSNKIPKFDRKWFRMYIGNSFPGKSLKNMGDNGWIVVNKRHKELVLLNTKNKKISKICLNSENYFLKILDFEALDKERLILLTNDPQILVYKGNGLVQDLSLKRKREESASRNRYSYYSSSSGPGEGCLDVDRENKLFALYISGNHSRLEIYSYDGNELEFKAMFELKGFDSGKNVRMKFVGKVLEGKILILLVLNQSKSILVNLVYDEETGVIERILQDYSQMINSKGCFSLGKAKDGVIRFTSHKGIIHDLEYDQN